MSTIDNSWQFQDDMMEIEARLLQGKAKVDFTLYERNSMNKINFRSYWGKNFLCSSQDKYRKIRVPITALLLKVLSSKNEKNLQRMRKIKRLIYSSSLQRIANKHAINSDELFSNFVFTINQLQFERQDIESSLVRKLNNEPFFDQIIMESFYDKFYDPSHEKNLTTSISKWIKNQLGISIIFVQNQTQLENDSVIFLRRNEKKQILREVMSFHICSMTSIMDESYDRITPLKPSNRFINGPNRNSKILQSLSSIESQYVRTSSKKDVFQQLVPISIQNSVQQLNVFQNKRTEISQEYDCQSTPIRKKRKGPSSESRFWKIFCCVSD